MGIQELKSQGPSSAASCPALKKSPSFSQKGKGNATHQRASRVNSYKDN